MVESQDNNELDIFKAFSEDSDIGFFNETEFEFDTVVNEKADKAKDIKNTKDIYAVIDGDGLPFKVSYWNKDLEFNEDNKVKIKQDTISCVVGIYKKIKTFTKANYVLGLIDKKEGSFRKDIFPAYKENRKDSGTDYQALWNPYIKQVLVEYGFYQIRDNIEVDDAMAILGKKAIDLDVELYLCGVDKDLLQIEGNHFNYDKEIVTIVDSLGTINNTKKGKRNVVEGTGFKWLMAQCIIGDSSDNIPGLPSNGPIAAYKVLQDCSSKYSCLKAVYKSYLETADKLEKKKAKNPKKELKEMEEKLLESPKDFLKLNYSLVKLLTSHEALDGFNKKEDMVKVFSPIEHNKFTIAAEEINLDLLNFNNDNESPINEIVNMSQALQQGTGDVDISSLFS